MERSIVRRGGGRRNVEGGGEERNLKKTRSKEEHTKQCNEE